MSEELASNPKSFSNLFINQESRKGFAEIEGKVTRVGANERGQRVSFKPGTPEGQDAGRGIVDS
jgi:hypothetical protein